MALLPSPYLQVNQVRPTAFTTLLWQCTTDADSYVASPPSIVELSQGQTWNHNQHMHCQQGAAVHQVVLTALTSSSAVQPH